MNKLLILLLLSFPYYVNAQNMERSDIIGTWTAIDGKTTSSELPPNAKQVITMMIDSFKESVWSFNDNGTFRITFKQNLSPVMEEMKFLDHKLWKFNSSSNQIRIGTKDDNYNHLVLSAKKVDNGMKVYFSDTPVYLILKKG